MRRQSDICDLPSSRSLVRVSLREHSGGGQRRWKCGRVPDVSTLTQALAFASCVQNLHSSATRRADLAHPGRSEQPIALRRWLAEWLNFPGLRRSAPPPNGAERRTPGSAHSRQCWRSVQGRGCMCSPGIVANQIPDLSDQEPPQSAHNSWRQGTPSVKICI